MNKQTKRILEMAGLTIGGFVLRSVIRRIGAFDLTGKVVAITGGSRGLGLVLAREFAKHGARLVICARDKQELDRGFSLPIHGITFAGNAVAHGLASAFRTEGYLGFLVRRRTVEQLHDALVKLSRRVRHYAMN
jgi:NAD(P)-dependent dehydrogenase (short-subunit alcohol dehydrogenase family)